MKRKHRLLKTAIIVAVLIIVAAVGYNKVMLYLYPRDFSEYVEKYSTEFSVDSDLVYAVIKCESNFEPQVESSASAKGLMQLTDNTFEWMQKLKDDEVHLDSSKIYDPETNIQYGVYLLSYLTTRYETEAEVLAAYNAGVGNVDGWIESYGEVTEENIPFEETRNYVKKVLKTKEIYKNLYSEE